MLKMVRTPSSFLTGAALYCANVAASVSEGVRLAREAVASGKALAKLSQFVAVTNRFRPA
jgi:anthranilate phosphoribosyltransferase